MIPLQKCFIAGLRCLNPPQALSNSRYKTITGARGYTAKTNSTVFEISGAVGGLEAMLFASDMLEVYLKYFRFMQWPHKIEERAKSEIGGIHQAKIIIDHAAAFHGLIQEAGVHRVQRVPRTEKSGRMHTSTVSVAVIPKSVLDITINEKDLEITTMRSSGPGGQHVNKTESAVRIVHKPTGLTTDSQVSRVQYENKKVAMGKLLEKLKSRELDNMTSQIEGLRRKQVGTANRNEKIRTYNFPQDRITEHRIPRSYQNLRRLFDGDVAVLKKIIDDYHLSQSDSQ